MLPESVRRAHAEGEHAGTFDVTRGPGRLGAIMAALLRWPATGHGVPVRLRIRAVPDGGQEWIRDIGGVLIVTTQAALSDGILRERMGRLECAFRLDADASGLTYRPEGATLVAGSVRVTLPPWIAPRIDARVEDASGGGVRVQVAVRVPGIGQVLRYGGCVAPVGAEP